MQKGWIKLHRKLLQNPIWQDPHYVKLWIYCLLEASHTEHEQLIGNQLVQLKPGQFVTGRISLSEEMNRGTSPKKKQSEATWWRYLENLEKWEMLNIKSTNKYSVITVENWGFYQDSEQKTDSKSTSNEQQMNNSRSSNEQQLNTNKNVKNLRIKELSTTTTTAEQKFGEVIQIFESNICPLSPMQLDSLGKWLSDFKNNSDIIIEAIKIADTRNKRTYGFVEFLLKEWANNNLKSVEQIQTYERNKFNKPKPSQKQWSRKPIRQEQLPDWFDKQEHEPSSNVINMTGEDLEARRKRLEAIQKKYKQGG